MFIDRVEIRRAKRSELPAIIQLQSEVFGQEDEGILVRKLEQSPSRTYSLVAVNDGNLIAHILYTEISAPVKALQLAPLGVSSPYRDLQVGSTLVRYGNRLAQQAGYDAVFVLGDSNFYERFDFDSKLADLFASPFQCRNFLVADLSGSVSSATGGKLVYPDPYFA